MGKLSLCVCSHMLQTCSRLSIRYEASGLKVSVRSIMLSQWTKAMELYFDYYKRSCETWRYKRIFLFLTGIKLKEMFNVQKSAFVSACWVRDLSNGERNKTNTDIHLTIGTTHCLLDIEKHFQQMVRFDYPCDQIRHRVSERMKNWAERAESMEDQCERDN